MRKLKIKTKKPRVPWNKTQIKEEKKIVKEYGLRRKKEIRSAQAILRNFRHRTRTLIAENDKEKEKILLDKLSRLGFIKGTKDLDSVLALNITDILDRRIQTIIYKKGMAKTALEARQIITHGHVVIENRKISFPSYIVPLEEEKRIAFHENSPMRKR